MEISHVLTSPCCSQLDHPNVVKLLAFYEDKRHFYLVMELLTGGELLESLLARSSYSEVEARTLVQTLADAIGYCHTKGVVHRDLKVCVAVIVVVAVDMAAAAAAAVAVAVWAVAVHVHVHV